MKNSLVRGAQQFLAAVFALTFLLSQTLVVGADEIHDAAARGDVAAIEKALAGNPSALNSRGDIYMQEVDTHATGTALNVAVMHNQKDAVKVLLAKGADINSKSNAGNTPLHMAAWRGYKDILEILLAAKGCDVNAVNSAGKTPLHMAVEGFPRGEQPSAAERGACADLLLKKGAKAEAKDSEGNTPLQLAQNDGGKELVAAFQKGGLKIAAPAPVEAPKNGFIVPFQINPVLLVKATVNGKVFTFVFDTGASHTVMSTAAAQAAGVRGTADIGAGDAILKNQRVMVQDIPQFGQFAQLGLKVSGILGYPYVSQFVTTFDYRRKQLTLIPRSAAPDLNEEAGSTIVPFDLNPVAHILFVKTKVNGSEPLTFLVDSGSQEVFLTPNTANKLGIKGGATEQTNIGMVSSAKVNSIAVGGVEVKNVKVMIANPPQAQMLNQIGQRYDGILGRGFFDRFLITLDYRTNKLKLTPNQ